MRNSEGRWNLEKLIERAAKTPVAPTAKTRSEARPGFPYIEADHGRINFKFGQEKKPYTLTEANFALWQDSENAWGIRLKAQPTRTDFNLSDTGVLDRGRIVATLGKICMKRPCNSRRSGTAAQLGQVTKLTLGQDKGWRGAVRLAATLTGTPKNLTVDTGRLHRGFPPLRHFWRCGLALGGAVQRPLQHHRPCPLRTGLPCPGRRWRHRAERQPGTPPRAAYDLTMLAQDLPAPALVEFARRVKKNIPTDIVAAGSLAANITLRRLRPRPGMGPVWQGGGT